MHYTYNGDQLIEEETPAGITTYSYDRAGRKMKEQIQTKAGLLKKEYGYDAMGRLTSESTTGADTKPLVKAFKYDVLNRIIWEETYGGPAFSYTYDGHGNKKNDHAVYKRLRVDRNLHPRRLQPPHKKNRSA